MNDNKAYLEQLIKQIVHPYFANEIADILVAHGVTIPQWISVDERLPEENQRVILYIPRVAEGGNVRSGWLEPTKLWFTDSRDRLLYKQVTHWMPLPMPPKEDLQW